MSAPTGIDDPRWIPWEGGECPVSPDTLVYALLQGEVQFTGYLEDTAPSPARTLRWDHIGKLGDIVAYMAADDDE